MLTLALRKCVVAFALSFVAVVAAAAQSVTGDWDASMNTPGGVRTFRLVLKQDGEKLSGTVKRESGDVPLEGTVVGGNVKFAYSINYGGNPITLTMTAVVAGDEMKGQVDIASQMQDVFSAKRVVGEKPVLDPQGGPAGR
jgi:hypothetical protein